MADKAALSEVGGATRPRHKKTCDKNEERKREKERNIKRGKFLKKMWMELEYEKENKRNRNLVVDVIPSQRARPRVITLVNKVPQTVKTSHALMPMALRKKMEKKRNRKRGRKKKKKEKKQRTEEIKIKRWNKRRKTGTKERNERKNLRKKKK